MQVPELRGRVDPQLLGQEAPCALEGGERLRLASGAVERQHELAPQTLPHRMVGRGGFKLGHHLGMLAEVEARRDALFDRDQMQLFEPCDLTRQRGLGGQIGERRTPPQVERLVEHVESRLGIQAVLADLPQERLEPEHVELLGIGAEQVAGGRPLDPLCPERSTQARDVGLERPAGGLRWLICPNGVDEVICGNGRVHT
jgi:hypothetical protein